MRFCWQFLIKLEIASTFQKNGTEIGHELANISWKNLSANYSSEIRGEFSKNCRKVSDPTAAKKMILDKFHENFFDEFSGHFPHGLLILQLDWLRIFLTITCTVFIELRWDCL